MTEEKKTTEEMVTVPDEIKDFVGLLRDHEVKEPKAVSIAKFIAATGSDKVFEQPEELANFLGRWPRDLAPVQRRRILEQWFAERGIVVPEKLLTRTSLHPSELGKEEKKEAMSKRLEEGRIWTIRNGQLAIAHEGEMATSLDEVKNALKELGGDEAIVLYDEKTGKHMPNYRAQFVKENPMIGITTAKQYDTMLAAGEEANPLDIFIDQLAKIDSMRELMGGGKKEEKTSLTDMVSAVKDLREMAAGEKKDLPEWMRDPVVFQRTIQELTPKSEGGALEEMRAELARVRESFHQAELKHKDEQLAQMGNAVQGYRNEVSQLRSDMEQNKQLTGRSAYDLLGDLVKKVPDKEDVRQMVSEMASRGIKLEPRSPAERGRVLDKMGKNLAQAAEVEAVEDMWFKWK